MATCKECIHFEVCEPYTAPDESYPEVGGCPVFKHKDEFVPVVHGRWDTAFVERKGVLGHFLHICEECKHTYSDLRSKGYNYCPNCGADMTGGENNV